jgi:hypothetical protein
MEYLTSDIDISVTSLHEWMPSVAYNSIENEFLIMWHSTGIREEGGENMYSLHAQRISSDGKLLGESFSPLKSAGPERRLLPRAAYNPFLNEYMVSFAMGQEETDWDPFITILDGKGNTVVDSYPVSEQPTKSAHPNIVFNSVRRQYFMVYNDSRTGSPDVFGIILDEDGTVLKEDILINTSAGDQMNPAVCYNPIDDTYLVNWEDFRNVANWMEDGDIYGALLDGQGNIIVNDIPMVDDHEVDDEGDQRVQEIAYNSDRNEFLTMWWDSSPSLDGGGIKGRIIDPEGTALGSDFVVVDAPGSQTFPHAEYIESKKMYFMIWDDTRNTDNSSEGSDATRDVYAGWLNPDGTLAGDDVPITAAEGTQRYSEFAYNPLMDRFLVVYRDEVDEAVSEGGSGHIAESGGNILGMLYGVPSFLTCRVVDSATGNPVENAKAVVIGPCLPAVETTNSGGWFNIAKGSYFNGKYFMIVQKKGYQLAIESITYTGDPVETTINISMN